MATYGAPRAPARLWYYRCRARPAIMAIIERIPSMFDGLNAKREPAVGSEILEPKVRTLYAGGRRCPVASVPRPHYRRPTPKATPRSISQIPAARSRSADTRTHPT